MKKIWIIVCLLMTAQLAAQNNSDSKILAKVAKSNEDIANPKKSLQVNTWMNRATLFLDVWQAPVKNVMAGMSNRDIKIVLASEKIKESLTEKIDDATYNVDVYENKKLYYDESGVLSFWLATYPVDAPLFKVLEAYKEAASLDTKNTSSKKIRAGLIDLQTKFNSDALSAYNIHDYSTALQNFEASLACSSHPLVGQTDSLIILYAGMVARLAGENVKAFDYYGKAMEIGYDQEGDVYATYADMLTSIGDTTTAITTLTTGFAKYPTNQSIIIGLINTYLQKGDDPKKILPYVEQAQQNDPDNSSLYYAEGIVYEQLEDIDSAERAYKKALEKDASNFYACYSLGALYFNKAVAIQNEAAMEADDAKYEAMMKDFDNQFNLSLPYLEKAYQLNSSEKAVVESLKSIYFRLREKSPEMQAKYEFYDNRLREM